MYKIKIFFTSFLYCMVSALQAQTDQSRIDSAISAEKFEEAARVLKTETERFISNKNFDTLSNYIYYVGTIAKKKKNTQDGIDAVNRFVSRINSYKLAPQTQIQLQLNAAEYFSLEGKNDLAYNAYEKALAIATKNPGNIFVSLGTLYNNLGISASRMGNLSLSQSHHRKAILIFEADKIPNYENLYFIYNALGGSMWYASKLDSARLYFEKAIGNVQKLDKEPLNQFYRPALIQNNIAGIYSIQGKTTDAIAILKSAITKLRSYLATGPESVKKNNAIQLQFEAIDNLGGIYKELGDYKQAHDLLYHSYKEKEKSFGEEDPEVYKSLVLLGQLYYAMREYDKAEQFLEKGMLKFEKYPGDFLFWKGDASNTLALLNDFQGQDSVAKQFYEKAYQLYEESFQGEYDNIFLEFQINLARFYAENNYNELAHRHSRAGYEYVVKTQGSNSLGASYQLLNLSDVNYLSGNYEKALAYGEQAIGVVNTIIRTSDNLLDSIKLELQKPKLILANSKARYKLLKARNEINLSALLAEMNEGLNLIEKRKLILSDPESITTLMADHSELLEFIKKITLELYLLTNDEKYSERLINLYESGLYNRIRSRLDKNKQQRFTNVPLSIQEKERTLKNNISDVLQTDKSHDEKIKEYFKAVQIWTDFQKSLANRYPKYYSMRYASVNRPIKEIINSIPAKTTIVRYMFIDTGLYAMVADNKNSSLVKLENKDIKEKIAALSTQWINPVSTGENLYQLYQQIWKPFENKINNNRIIIIPDGILFNLNFETLTREKIRSFRDISTKGLIADKTISYHYSLFLLKQENENRGVLENFVAFAPGFSDDLKKAYRGSNPDSIEVDNIYLSLLPLPFTNSLASRANDLLGGTLYLNQQSTKGKFMLEAGQHKIIHIGTHGESNNSHPEFSRLFFAKSPQEEEDNSLYLHEIYNCNLLSELTVLTACETGKPGFKDGEGMISLAHAFNYAGSESILTSLWKIDEQSSARILDFFYAELSEGKPKDEALRQAKLKYLSESDGRTLSPQYWAGLVIMGDTDPVIMNNSNTWIYWIAGILIVLSVAYFVYQKRFRSNKKS